VLAGAYQLYERNGECGLAVNAPATVEEAFTAFEHVIGHRRHAWADWRRANDGPARPVQLVRAAAVSFTADGITILMQRPQRLAPPRAAGDAPGIDSVHTILDLIQIDLRMPLTEMRRSVKNALRELLSRRPAAPRAPRHLNRTVDAWRFMYQHPTAQLKSLADHLSCSMHAAKRARARAKRWTPLFWGHAVKCTTCRSGHGCPDGIKLLEADAGRPPSQRSRAPSQRRENRRRRDEVEQLPDESGEGPLEEVATVTARKLATWRRRGRRRR